MSVVTSSAGIGPGYWDNYPAGFMVGIVLVLWLRRYFFSFRPISRNTQKQCFL